MYGRFTSERTKVLLNFAVAYAAVDIASRHSQITIQCVLRVPLTH